MRDISSPILFDRACQMFEFEILPFIKEQYEPVSYTHLTLPTICSV